MFHPVELTLFWGLVKAKSATAPVGSLSSYEGDASFHSHPARAGKPCVQGQLLRVRPQMERAGNTWIILPLEIVWAKPIWMKGKGNLVRIFDLAFKAPGG